MAPTEAEAAERESEAAPIEAEAAEQSVKHKVEKINNRTEMVKIELANTQSNRLIMTAACSVKGKTDMMKIVMGNQYNRLIMELAIRKIKHRSMNKFGPEYSSDDSGDGPITITASLLIDLGRARSNVSLTVSVKGGNFFAAWRANTGKELRRVYKLERLRYSEKGQHASLEGDGFRLIADQMAMRMLFSRAPIRRAGVATYCCEYISHVL